MGIQKTRILKYKDREKNLEETVSKIVLDEKRLQLDSDQVDQVLTGIFTAVGFPENIADSISSHLIDANLVGVESHGIMRVLEYVDEVKSGVLNASSRPCLLYTSPSPRDLSTSRMPSSA